MRSAFVKVPSFSPSQRQKAASIVEDARAEADAIRMQSKADAEAAEEQDARRRAELEAAETAHQERLTTTRETAEREIAEARARLAAEQQEHTEAATAADGKPAGPLRGVDRVRDPRHQVEADFRIAMDQRRKEALTALTAEQLATRAATEEMRERAHAEGRRMIQAAQTEAARIVAEAGAVVRLRMQRQRIVEQLAAASPHRWMSSSPRRRPRPAIR